MFYHCYIVLVNFTLNLEITRKQNLIGLSILSFVSFFWIVIFSSLPNNHLFVFLLCCWKDLNKLEKNKIMINTFCVIWPICIGKRVAMTKQSTDSPISNVSRILSRHIDSLIYINRALQERLKSQLGSRPQLLLPRSTSKYLRTMYREFYIWIVSLILSLQITLLIWHSFGLNFVGLIVLFCCFYSNLSEVSLESGAKPNIYHIILEIKRDLTSREVFISSINRTIISSMFHIIVREYHFFLFFSFYEFRVLQNENSNYLQELSSNFIFKILKKKQNPLSRLSNWKRERRSLKWQQNPSCLSKINIGTRLKCSSSLTKRNKTNLESTIKLWEQLIPTWRLHPLHNTKYIWRNRNLTEMKKQSQSTKTQQQNKQNQILVGFDLQSHSVHKDHSATFSEKTFLNEISCLFHITLTVHICLFIQLNLSPFDMFIIQKFSSHHETIKDQ